MALPDPLTDPTPPSLPPRTVSVFCKDTRSEQLTEFPTFFHFWRHKMQIDSNTSFDSDSDLNQENVANNIQQSSDRLVYNFS